MTSATESRQPLQTCHYGFFISLQWNPNNLRMVSLNILVWRSLTFQAPLSGNLRELLIPNHQTLQLGKCALCESRCSLTVGPDFWKCNIFVTWVLHLTASMNMTHQPIRSPLQNYRCRYLSPYTDLRKAQSAKRGEPIYSKCSSKAGVGRKLNMLPQAL